MKGLALGVVVGIALGGLSARGALVNRITPPPQVIIHEVSRPETPRPPIKLDSVVRLYGPDGHVEKEYTGAFTVVDQSQGAIRFKLENGRTVILGGSFSVEEIPHQERGR